MDDVTASIIIACQTAGAVNSINKLGFAMGMLGKQAVSLFYQFGRDSLHSFNVAQDVSWKFGKTFRNSMGTATKAVKEFIEEYNLSEQTAKSMLTDTASILKGFGFSEKDALKMSEQVSRMGIDLASFTGVAGGAKEAVSSITSALTGETERMKKYGTVIRMDDKALVSLTKTIQKNKGVSETQARSMAILQEIIKQNTDAIGDYKAEGENWTQAQNNQRESIIALKDALGEMIYKLFDVYGITEKITEITKSIANWINTEGPTIVYALDSVWISLQEGAESASVLLQPFFSGIIAGFKNIVTVGQWMYDNWERILEGMSKSETNVLHGFGKDIFNTTKDFIIWTGDSAMAYAEFMDNMIGWNKLLYGKNQYYYQYKAYNSMLKTVANLGSETEKALKNSGVTEFPKLEEPDYSAWTDFYKTQDEILKKYQSKRISLDEYFSNWIKQRNKNYSDKNINNQNVSGIDVINSIDNNNRKYLNFRSSSQAAVLANSVEAIRLQSRRISKSPEMKIQEQQLDVLNKIRVGIEKISGPQRTSALIARG